MRKRIGNRAAAAAGILAASMLFIGTASAGSAGLLVMRYLPGRDYQVIDKPVDSGGDKIRVIEFFLYSCSHCYAFDDAISQWQRTLTQDVVFRRVPVLFGAGSRTYARLFYTAKILGVLDRLHEKIFDAIHQKGMNLADFETARGFFAAHGVDRQRFSKVFNSFAVDRKVARAARLMRAFGVRAVPSLGIAGRYWISGRMAGGNKAMLKVAEYLIERVRRSTSGPHETTQTGN